MPRKTPLTHAQRYGGILPAYMTRALVEGDGATHKEIAKELGITHQRVAQIEARAVLRLRRVFMLIDEGVPMNDAIQYCRTPARFLR